MRSAACLRGRWALSIVMFVGATSSDAEAQERPVVALGASANSRREAEVAADWPVVVEAVIQRTPEASGAVRLTGVTDSWSDAFRLECRGPGGIDRSSLFGAALASEKSIDLTSERSGVVVWILDSVDLETLPKGEYRIQVSLVPGKLIDAALAGLRSNAVELTVSADASSVGAGVSQRRCLARMSAAIWKDDFVRAVATADAHLATNPKDVAVWFRRGEVLRRLGKKADALASFERALAAAAHAVGENHAIELAVIELRRELFPDPGDQWALTAEASSEFGSPSHGAREATGAPDAKTYGFRAEGWASRSADDGVEWLKLTYATEVRAIGVRVRQSFNPGAIVKVEALASDGRSAVLWSGRDDTEYPKDQIAWFVATFEPPPFPVKAIRLTLDLAVVKGWNLIDAVQLVGDP